jgi:hypothetical protein
MFLGPSLRTLRQEEKIDTRCNGPAFWHLSLHSFQTRIQFERSRHRDAHSGRQFAGGTTPQTSDQGGSSSEVIG